MALPVPLLLLLLLSSSLSQGTPLNIYKFHDNQPLTIPLTRRNLLLDLGSTEKFLDNQRKGVEAKYGVLVRDEDGLVKRQSSTGGASAVVMSNYFADAEYTGLVSVGTPAQDFQVILDTGSADLWISTAPCSCDSSVPLYEPTSSSTSKSSSTPFAIVYGSGNASGTLEQDTVTIGGFTVQNQIFAAVTDSFNVVSDGVSGILGLGWQPLATSKATPLVQAIANGGQLPEQSFSFAMTRFANISSAYNKAEPGGIMTLGGTNSSLFTGDINFNSLTSSGSFWLIQLDDITVGGSSTSTSSSSVAIDTGTSLIGGPPADVRAIYSQIDGSQPVTIQGVDGYWAYPCKALPSVAMKFGGISYAIDPADFNAGTASSNTNVCLGAFFEIETSRNNPDWIVGAAFLKNVYTNFRFSPNPAVGFASLSSNAQRIMVLQGTAPASNSDATSVGGGDDGGNSNSGSGSGSGKPSGAFELVPSRLSMLVATAALVVGFL
ncbi:acid protease [Meredithblackwellia eburnea MCA 4105]